MLLGKFFFANNFPAEPARIAGNRNRSPTRAVNNSTPIISANFAVGMKMLNRNGQTPIPQINDVSIIALAQC